MQNEQIYNPKGLNITDPVLRWDLSWSKIEFEIKT